MQVKFKRVYDVAKFPKLKDTPYPKYATEYAAGMDLRAMLDFPWLQLAPGETAVIPTGIATYIANPWYMGLITVRSGWGMRGLELTNGVGIVDADYQGEILLSVRNAGRDPLHITTTERLAQLLIVPVVQVDMVEVPSFESNTARGVGGFGHTGNS